MDTTRVLLDIEVQQDFFDPSGSCYRKGAGKIASRIYQLFDWARTNEIPVMSTLLRVRHGEIGPLCDVPHCMDGTDGEKKMPRTILPRRVNLGLRNITDLPNDLFEAYQQVIFEKRDTDLFAHARAERLITEMPKATFIVCGAGIAHGIVQAAVGLRNRQFPVICASDAVFETDDPKEEMARLRMSAKGVIFAPVQEITVPRPASRLARMRKSLSTR